MNVVALELCGGSGAAWWLWSCVVAPGAVWWLWSWGVAPGAVWWLPALSRHYADIIGGYVEADIPEQQRLPFSRGSGALGLVCRAVSW